MPLLTQRYMQYLVPHKAHAFIFRSLQPPYSLLGKLFTL